MKGWSEVRVFGTSQPNQETGKTGVCEGDIVHDQHMKSYLS